MLRKITCLFIVIFLTISLLLPSYTFSKSNSLEKTINHLLKYMEESGCIFIRNNKEHDSKYAAEHVRKKYDYFKGKINTPEEFIELCATKSLMSGKPYFVRCENNTEISSADWLKAELDRYRSKISQAKPTNQ